VTKKLALYLLLFFLVPLSFIPFRGLWAPDEARYARVAAEMKEAGSLVVPKLNGALYAEKPPLFFDLAVLASLFSKSVPEYAVKIVSLLSSLLVALLLAAIGKKFGLKDAALPVIFLLGMPRFLWQAQFGQIDMLLCALVYLQFYFGLSLLEDDKGTFRNVLLLGLSSFLAIVSKGPAGVLPALIVLVAFAFIFGYEKRVAAAGGALAVTLILSAAWLAAAGVIAGWDYPKSLLFRQTVTRYLDPWHHYAPWHYYLTVMWGDGFPVILFLIPVLTLVIRKKELRDKRWLFPLLVIIVWLLFFSVSSAKRSVYILPIYPAAALLVSFAAEKWRDGEWDKRGLKLISAAALLVFAAATILASATGRIPAEFTGLRIPLVAGLAVYLAAALVSLLLLIRKDRFAPQLFAAASCIFMLATGLPVVRALDPVKTPYALAGALKPKLSGDHKLAVFGSLVPSVNYYLGTTTRVFSEKEQEEAADFIAEGGYLLIEREELEKSGLKEMPAAWKGKIGGSDYLVITAKEGPKPETGSGDRNP